MTRRVDLVIRFALLLCPVVGTGCSPTTPQILEVGHHRIRFVLPRGWEHLDHGRQQLFRSGEWQISLVDLGPATNDAMARELRAAERVWLAGHRPDAFERVRELRSPALRFAPSQQRADFWRPWTDVTYVPEAADSAAIGPAFAALIAGTGSFARISPESMIEYVLVLATDPQRREIAHRDIRSIHGAAWVMVETWDHVSHLNRSRVAFLENDGYLLVLAIDRGPFEQTSPAFESLLSSFEVMSGAAGVR